MRRDDLPATGGEVIWDPSPDWRSTTRIGAFVEWLDARGVAVESWDELWRWSVDDLDGFWTSVWDYYGVRSSAPWESALKDRALPGAVWFEGARVNYARHLLVDADPSGEYDSKVAVTALSQTRERLTLTFAELRDQVSRVAAGLSRLGVGPGDRVVAYLPNIPETLVAFLATSSLGAVWAACAPEFGSRSVVDRFEQIEPSVLLGVSGYRYGAKEIDRSAELAGIAAALDTVRTVVHVPYGDFDQAPPGSVGWRDLVDAMPRTIEFAEVPFDHPLCVLFSSGTTGKPKPIVHGHGGILLEHLKNHGLHWDLGPGDRILWHTTTAWMVWNALVSALLVRASVVMLDGDPTYPDRDQQWRVAAETGATVMGLSPGFIMAARAAGSEPGRDHDLGSLRQVVAAGSPLAPAGYRWISAQLPGVLLNVGSGGTDVCSGIVQGSPAQPVVLGEMSGPCLGVDARAVDATGATVVGELGELVIAAPMPSMPVGLWGDEDGERLRATYFDQFPGVWRHGDWIRFSASGSCVITGRSDATLNRGGVRLGTAEFYQVVEELDEVADSLVVHLEDPDGGPGELLLYVVLTPGHLLDGDVRERIVAALRGALSPRHVPDSIHAVPSVPRNRTGKKLELPVKHILQGRAVAEVTTPGSLADDSALDAFLRHRETRASRNEMRS